MDIDLRPWADGDLPLLERLMGDPAMTEHLGGPETPEKIRERHERYCRSSDSGKDFMFVIVVGPERVAAGSIGYWEREWQGRHVWETGWSVLPQFQGQGVATRSTAAVVERACAEGKHQFIHAFPSVDNGPSNAICRKVGFTLQEEVDFEYPPGNSMRCNDWRFDLFADGRKMRGEEFDMERISRKEGAISFLRLASSGKVKEAYRSYVGAGFRHHNPYFQGDAATLMAAMEENAAANPNKAIEIHHALEEGDLVAIHACVKLKPGDLGIVTIHLFHFENDRIVELWDVGQPVPADSPNKNGMF